jgi:hypothetical protein
LKILKKEKGESEAKEYLLVGIDDSQRESGGYRFVWHATQAVGIFLFFFIFLQFIKRESLKGSFGGTRLLCNQNGRLFGNF